MVVRCTEFRWCLVDGVSARRSCALESESDTEVNNDDGSGLACHGRKLLPRRRLTQHKETRASEGHVIRSVHVILDLGLAKRLRLEMIVQVNAIKSSPAKPSIIPSITTCISLPLLDFTLAVCSFRFHSTGNSTDNVCVDSSRPFPRPSWHPERNSSHPPSRFYKIHLSQQLL